LQVLLLETARKRRKERENEIRRLPVAELLIFIFMDDDLKGIQRVALFGGEIYPYINYIFGSYYS
jgi:hypothetical protein